MAAGAFYLAFLGLMFLGFTGHISRVTLARDVPDAAGSLDTLIFRAARERTLRDMLAEQRERISSLERERLAKESAGFELSDKYYLQLQRLQEAFLPVLMAITSHPDVVTAEWVASVRGAYVGADEDLEVKADRLSDLIAAPQFVDNVSTDDVGRFSALIPDVLTDLNERRAALREANAAWDRADKEEELLEKALASETQMLADLEAELDSISKSLSDSNRAVIASYESFAGGLPYTFLKIPTIILTLLVTVSAGGLGACMAFTRAVFRGAAPVDTLPHLLANIAEGVAAAVAIFLLAGSGMLMLTQGVEGTDRNVELSPYLIACTAFISGFMAEDAFQRISLAAKNLFHTPQTS